MVVANIVEGYFNYREKKYSNRLDSYLEEMKEMGASKSQFDKAFELYYDRITFNIDRDVYDKLDGKCHSIAIDKTKNGNEDLYNWYYYTEYIKRIILVKLNKLFSF